MNPNFFHFPASTQEGKKNLNTVKKRDIEVNSRTKKTNKGTRRKKQIMTEMNSNLGHRQRRTKKRMKQTFDPFYAPDDFVKNELNIGKTPQQIPKLSNKKKKKGKKHYY